MNKWLKRVLLTLAVIASVIVGVPFKLLVWAMVWMHFEDAVNYKPTPILDAAVAKTGCEKIHNIHSTELCYIDINFAGVPFRVTANRLDDVTNMWWQLLHFTPGSEILPFLADGSDYPPDRLGEDIYLGAMLPDFAPRTEQNKKRFEPSIENDEYVGIYLHRLVRHKNNPEAALTYLKRDALEWRREGDILIPPGGRYGLQGVESFSPPISTYELEYWLEEDGVIKTFMDCKSKKKSAEDIWRQGDCDHSFILTPFPIRVRLRYSIDHLPDWQSMEQRAKAMLFSMHNAALGQNGTPP